MHYGIREHAMCAMVNGMVLTGLRAFGSGFLIFTDYARGAIRLSSLMDLPVHSRLDPRFHQPRRGWTDASADRADDFAACDPRHGGAAAGGCE